jgi:antitoxin ParD1/3/4
MDNQGRNPMRTTQSLSITLPHDMAEMVRAKVRSGEYATESEVIRDGLRVLAARDSAVEKWLREEVAATFDAVKADPAGTTESAAETWRQLQAHMDSRDNHPASGK